MMNLGKADADRLTLYEFTAMRTIWNDRHKPDDPEGEPVEPPSAEAVKAAQAELYELGIAGRSSN
jgi:hypothetical protein